MATVYFVAEKMTVSSSATHIMPLVRWISVHHIGELNFCALVDSS